MAKDGALDELLAEVLSRYDNSPNPRLKEVTTAAIRHLHAFAREVNLTREGHERRPVEMERRVAVCDLFRQCVSMPYPAWASFSTSSAMTPSMLDR
jgi:hypothetical protein